MQLNNKLLSGKRIFIVEDNLENRVISQLLLEAAGAKISYERWGITTVSRLRSFMPVDLILMDLMFPNNVTGYTITANIRENPDLAKIPVVIVSASDAEEEIPKAQELGFAGYLVKPIEAKTFAENLHAILNGTPVWQLNKSL